MIFIFITVISSCNSDDNEINQTHELVGRWQRSWQLNEYVEKSYYRLDFSPDNYGSWSTMVFCSDVTAIGAAETFTWNTTDNPKTLIIPIMELNTPYSINSDGQLILNNFERGEPFDKIE